MSLYNKARSLVHAVAIGVARGEHQTAEKLMWEALKDAQIEVEPELVELEAEVSKLRKVIACRYIPTCQEWKVWIKYCEGFWAIGDTPPLRDYDEWCIGLAISHWESDAPSVCPICGEPCSRVDGAVVFHMACLMEETKSVRDEVGNQPHG